MRRSRDVSAPEWSTGSPTRREKAPLASNRDAGRCCPSGRMGTLASAAMQISRADALSGPLAAHCDLVIRVLAAAGLELRHASASAFDRFLRERVARQPG